MVGRGHNSTRPRRIMDAPSNVQRGECCSIKREGGGTTIPDTEGSYPLQPRHSGRRQKHHVGGRGHKSTRPRRIIPPSLNVQTGECCSIKRDGRVTTVPDPEGSYPLQTRHSGKKQKHHVGERGHISTRPRRIIPSATSSKWEKQPYHEAGRGHNRTRPLRIICSTPSSRRKKTAASRGREGAQPYQTP